MNIVRPALPLASNEARPSQARIDDVSRKLESQFTQMLVKCMREASFGDSLLPQENQVYRDLYDRQMADVLSQGKGLGLAPMIARQLGRSAGNPQAAGETGLVDPAPAARSPMLLRRAAAAYGGPDAMALRALGGDDAGIGELAAPAFEPGACDEVQRVAESNPDDFPAGTPEHFVAKIWPHARRAGQELGVDPRALVAQAALETGWGRRGIRDGSKDANNLFGIKATGWSGARVNTATHEYVDGQRRSERADFRAYGSAEESFADYVRMLKGNPRYQKALHAGNDVQRFASELQRAGYATDPLYARKIAAIANGPTLDRALGGGSANLVASR